MNGKASILIVDDVVENIQVAMNVLKEDNYNLAFALNGQEALELIQKNSYDLILLDIMMPGVDGFEVCQSIKTKAKTKDIPVIFLTAKNSIDSISKAFEIGGVDYILKPFNADELLSRVRTHIELYQSRKVLALNNLSLKIKSQLEKKRLLDEIQEAQKELIYILAELTEVVSDETGKHIKRVAEISKVLAHYHPALSLKDEEIIFHTAPMHDVGKIAIDPEILHKKDALNEDEFNIMKKHTELAHSFFKKSDREIIKSADIIAIQHHEKWDGSGYPKGLKGSDIHIYGRIVALADVFDALTHKRVYKDAWSIDQAVEHIKKSSGSHFDPQLVAIFLEHLDEFIAIVTE